MFFSKFNFLAIKGVAGLHDVRIWSLEGEIDIFAANVVLDDETLEKQSDETKQTIRATLLNHHSEHSTIELESKCQCTGNVCEENNT